MIRDTLRSALRAWLLDPEPEATAIAPTEDGVQPLRITSDTWLYVTTSRGRVYELPLSTGAGLMFSKTRLTDPEVYGYSGDVVRCGPRGEA